MNSGDRKILAMAQELARNVARGRDWELSFHQRQPQGLPKAPPALTDEEREQFLVQAESELGLKRSDAF